MSEMEQFDFASPAEMFVGSPPGRRRGAVKYMRFQSAAEAIRHAIERQGARQLASTIVEVQDVRVGAAEIRSLYDSAGYPLARNAGTAAEDAGI